MSVDVKRIQSIYISAQTIQKRLAYIRTQIEKCEGDIPSKLWCSNCKDRIKKIKRLLDKLQEAKTHPPLSDKIFTQLPENYGYDDHRTKRGFIGPKKETDYDFHGFAYVCVVCREGFPETHTIYDRKEDLVHDGKWRCPVCDSDKIVVLSYSSKGCIERNLNDDDEVSTTSNLYQYACLDCGAGYVKKEDLSKTWKLDKNMWTCPKCFSTNVVYVDSDGEQGLNGDLE